MLRTHPQTRVTNRVRARRKSQPDSGSKKSNLDCVHTRTHARSRRPAATLAKHTNTVVFRETASQTEPPPTRDEDAQTEREYERDLADAVQGALSLQNSPRNSTPQSNPPISPYSGRRRESPVTPRPRGQSFGFYGVYSPQPNQQGVFSTWNNEYRRASAQRGFNSWDDADAFVALREAAASDSPSSALSRLAAADVSDAPVQRSRTERTRHENDRSTSPPLSGNDQ